MIWWRKCQNSSIRDTVRELYMTEQHDGFNQETPGDQLWKFCVSENKTLLQKTTVTSKVKSRNASIAGRDHSHLVLCCLVFVY